MSASLAIRMSTPDLSYEVNRSLPGVQEHGLEEKLEVAPMIGPPAGTRIWIVAGVTDLRSGFEQTSFLLGTTGSGVNSSFEDFVAQIYARNPCDS